MASGRVRTQHLSNAKPTLFRTSDIVTGMQLICSFLRLVYLYKTGKEPSLKSQAFVICTAETMESATVQFEDTIPVSCKLHTSGEPRHRLRFNSNTYSHLLGIYKQVDSFPKQYLNVNMETICFIDENPFHRFLHICLLQF